MINKCSVCGCDVLNKKSVCNVCVGGAFIYADEFFMADVDNETDTIKEILGRAYAVDDRTTFKEVV